MKANEILNNAAGHLKDRASTYDKPEGERSMQAAVDAMRAVSGVSMTAEQGWLFMALLKAVRTQQGGYRADNYEDGAAYFALAGEQAAVDRVAAIPRHEATPNVLEFDDHCAEAIHAEPSGEDMTEPANWRAGDIVEAVDTCSGQFTKGWVYRLMEDVAPTGYRWARVHEDDTGAHNGWGVENFRFHSRPSK